MANGCRVLLGSQFELRKPEGRNAKKKLDVNLIGAKVLAEGQATKRYGTEEWMFIA